MKRAREEAQAALHKAAEDMAKFYNEGRQRAPDYSIGQKVWLDTADLRTDRPSKKLDFKRQGPFEILDKVGSRAYKLKLPATWKVHPVFNVVKLRPYIEENIPGRRKAKPRPPALIEDVEEYDVEEILDSRIIRNKLHYLVKWEGYPHEENTWEPLENVTHAKDAVHEFHRANPGAPRQIGALYNEITWRPLPT